MLQNRRQAFRYAIDETDANALLRISEGEVQVRVADASAIGFGVVCDRELEVQEGEIAGLTTTLGQSICRVTRVEYEDGGTSIGLQRISEVADEPKATGNAGLLVRWFGRSTGSIALLVAFGVGLGLVMGFAKLRSLPLFPASNHRVLRQDIPRDPSERNAALTKCLNNLDELTSRKFNKDLQLTDGQQRRIDGIVEKLVFELAKVHLDRGKQSPEMAAHLGLLMIRRAWTRVEDTLTPEQLARWDRILDEQSAAENQAKL